MDLYNSTFGSHRHGIASKGLNKEKKNNLERIFYSNVPLKRDWTKKYEYLRYTTHKSKSTIFPSIFSCFLSLSSVDFYLVEKSDSLRMAFVLQLYVKKEFYK